MNDQSAAGLLLFQRFLLAGDRSPLPLARAGIRARPLTPRRESFAMTKTAVAADVRETLNVHLDFASERPLDLRIRLDNGTDRRNLFVGQLTDLLVVADLGLVQNTLGRRATYSVDIGQPNLRTFVFW